MITKVRLSKIGQVTRPTAQRGARRVWFSLVIDDVLMKLVFVLC